jgi:ankyrin repeat protein
MADILSAIRGGEVDAALAAIEEDPHAIRVRDGAGLSPVQLAAYEGWWDLVDAMLAKRPKLDPFEAAIVGDLDRVRELITEDHMLLWKRSPDGYTMLHLAAFFGRLEVLKLLLDHGAEVVTVSSSETAGTPLHSAVAGDDPETRLEVARALLRWKAPVDVAQTGGDTPLHIAAALGDRPLCELLVEHGADPARQNDDGHSPAETAEMNGHAGLAEWLRQGAPRPATG